MGKKKDIVEEIIEKQPENIEDSSSEFLEDFILETKEHIDNIEMYSLTLETEPENMDILNSMFRAFHTIKGLAGFVDQQIVQEVAHQTETLMDYCRKGKVKVNRKIIDLILTSADLIRKLCNCIELSRDNNFIKAVNQHMKDLASLDMLNLEEQHQPSGNSPELYSKKRIGEILIEQGKINEDDMNEILEKQKGIYSQLKLGQVAVKEKKVQAKDVIQSIRMQEDARSAVSGTSTSSNDTHIRVPTHKVDNLVDMMGELLIIQSLIEQEAASSFDTSNSIQSNLLRMARIIKDVQNLSMSLRMVSLKSTFQKINRIARDTILELDKNVKIQMSGEETEIDRNVAEKILEPLLHLVKNCISHGIEGEKERLSKGKPAKGQVEIKAYSKRGNVYIEIGDDGSGISLDKVYQKALEKNLIDSSVNYKEDDIVNFIFLPGFSTADTVDNISGRGVGLDVVKTEVSRIGGKIEVNNQPDKGCTFILKIPINLAVMNGTIVDIMGTHYIIPTLNIKEIVKPEESQWITVKDNTCMIKVREDIIPIIPIREVFGIEHEERRSAEIVAVMELEQKLKALPVQSIVGRREIVVKPVGSEFRDVDFISGASILGDGKVSLILDIETLFKIGV